MAAGIFKASRGRDPVRIIRQDRWTGGIDAEVAIFYGLEGNTPAIFEAYKREATAVYIDLGYWGRREGGRWTGYHKVAVNDRHPTRYLFSRPHDGTRARKFGLRFERMDRRGDAILLAGMSGKGAAAEGYEPEQWERRMVERIGATTDRPILYRPKPSWKEARPIPGTIWSGRDRPLELELARSWGVVTHHSNVAIDALLAGVWSWAEEGASTAIQDWTLDDVLEDSPRLRDPEFRRSMTASRVSLVEALTFCQWSIAEFRDGLPWHHLRTEGLV